MGIARHTGYNLAGTILPLIVSLATVPVYLNVVGLERYGVLSMCWLLLGYFGLFDLGLSRAVTQRIAAMANEPPQARAQVFWTAFWLSLILMTVASALLLPVAHYALHLVKFQTAEVASEVDRAAPWLAITLPVSLFAGILNGALTGRERFGLLNLADVLSNTLSAIVPLFLAWYFGAELWLLICGALGVRVLTSVLMGVFCYYAIPLRWPLRPHWGVARSLATYGGWVSVTSIVGPVLAVWDRFAVGWYLGAGAVSVYVIPFTLAMRVTLVPSALARALFPRFAAATEEASSALLGTSLSLLSLCMTPAALAGIWLGFPFLKIWLGHALAVKTAPLIAILMPGIWFNGMAQIVYTLLQARDRPQVVAKIHVAELLPYLAALFGGMYFFGLPGVAAAWTLRSAADALLLSSATTPGLAAMRRFVPAAVCASTAAIVAVALPVTGIVTNVILGSLTLGGTWLAYRACTIVHHMTPLRAVRRLVGV